jgi:DNA-binding NarL/FixJ family response regulator
LRQAGCRAGVIVLTMHDDPHLATRALAVGAAAYVVKDAATEDLLAALDAVRSGRTYVSPRLARRAAGGPTPARRDGAPTAPLVTPRQRQVLQLVAQGRSMKEIGRLLHVSRRTAEAHKYAMMQQLGIETTAELVRFAVREGLVAL